MHARNAARQPRGLGGVAPFVDSLDERELFFDENILYGTYLNTWCLVNCFGRASIAIARRLACMHEMMLFLFIIHFDCSPINRGVLGDVARFVDFCFW